METRLARVQHPVSFQHLKNLFVDQEICTFEERKGKVGPKYQTLSGK